MFFTGAGVPSLPARYGQFLFHIPFLELLTIVIDLDLVE
jgi:hypothetical protein